MNVIYKSSETSPSLRGAKRRSNPVRGGLDCFASLAMTRLASIQPLDRHGDALADADAHGGERALATALLHAVHRRQRKPRAAHAKRVTERDRAAMRIDEIGIFLDAQLSQASYPLAGKGFIELDQIEIADLEVQPFHQFARRRHRAD